MPLNKTTLKSQIKAAFEKEKESTDDAEKSIDRIATALSDSIDKYIKGATITVAAGIPVATAGSPTAQTGATTAPATATIS